MSRSLGSTDLKRLHRGWRRRATGHPALLLDSVETPANVGAILRTAAAFRIEQVFLTGRTPDPDTGGVQKTALGSQRFLDFRRIDAPEDAAAAVREAGYRLIAVELTTDAIPIHEADLTGSVCLAFGHEERGVSAPVLTAAETSVYIPQLGRIGSLNVAAAAAIAIHELRRQGHGPPAP